MADHKPYSVGAVVAIKILGDLHNGYITGVYPPITKHQTYLYDVKLFQNINSLDRINRASYIWIVDIEEK